MMAIRLLLVWSLALALAGCAEGLPTRAPDIAGTITYAGPGTILVEERPNETAGSAKASVRIADATTVWRATGAGQERASAADLVPGRLVRVWFDGPIAETYPVQATARAIVIVGP